MTALIAYYRVSTARQGQSGLGLEAQRATVAAYAARTAGDVVHGYTEVETGTRKRARPVLEQALNHAHLARARLVIAKMDRLTRDLHFLTCLERSKVDFVACDMPDANEMTIRIMVIMAEYEAKLIGQRTREALAAYKARGGLLGSARPECRDNLSAEAGRRGAIAAGEAHRRSAAEFAVLIRPRILAARAEGHPFRVIACMLNADRLYTRRGKTWTATQVWRVLRRDA